MVTISSSEASQLNQACVADKFRLLNRVITQLYDQALRPTGMTTSQMNILTVVAKYGETAPHQVRDWLHMEKSTLSRNVRRLQQNGWLTVHQSDKGRTHSLKLTSKGSRALRKGLPLWESAQKEAEAILGRAGIEEIMRVAGKVRSTGG
ncbi:MAG: MarR family winged helix-turn-helix transcriptional regulator [Acidobacteriota bacterium]